MISEKWFVKNYSSFWKELLPFSLTFIRAVNTQNKGQEKEIRLVTSGRRMSYVSHIGFLLFKYALENNLDNNQLEAVNLDSPDYKKIELVANGQFQSFNDEEYIFVQLNNKELIDAKQITSSYLCKYGQSVHAVFSPMFKGCGIIDDCYGDLLIDNTLWESKCVNRPFSINDFRQLLTYVALNFVSHQHSIDRIGVYNPRFGTGFSIPINEFSQNLAGRDYLDIFNELLNFVTYEINSK